MMDTGSSDPASTPYDPAERREQVRAKLGEISAEVQRELSVRSVEMNLFFVVGNTGDAILTVGTDGNPDDDWWEEVVEIVQAVVERAVGIERTRSRELARAASDPAVPIRTR